MNMRDDEQRGDESWEMPQEHGGMELRPDLEEQQRRLYEPMPGLDPDLDGEEEGDDGEEGDDEEE